MSKATFAFALAGDGTDTLELDVFSAIGESWWEETISASQVRRLLRANPNAKLIKGRFHTDGGDVFDAQAIYADLQAHPARKEAEVLGLAASAGSYVLMAFDEIRIAEGGWIMIHEPWGGATGLPSDLRNWANVLEAAAQTYADAYAKRTGMKRDDVLALMKAETWMTGAEAVAKGFADKLIPANTKTHVSAGVARAQRSVLRSVAFAAASGDYRNVPHSVRVELGSHEADNGRKHSMNDTRRYENYSGPELAQLEHSDPDAFARLRRDWVSRGQPEFRHMPAPAAANAVTWEGKRYEQLTGPQSAALQHSDPDAFARLQADWVKRGHPEFEAING